MTAYPVKRQKLTDSAASQLLGLIQAGGLMAGQRLPAERVLAEQMSISRASLRAAIARLEVLGHLEVRQGDGVYVREPTAANLTQPFLGILSRQPQSVRDLLEFRQMIEPQVAARAATRATPEQLRQLQASLDGQHQAAAAHINLGEVDLQFHSLIAQMAGNQVVQGVLGTLRGLLTELRQQVLSGDQPHTTIQEHAAVVQAILGRDPQAAHDAMSRHIQSVIHNAERTHTLQGGNHA